MKDRQSALPVGVTIDGVAYVQTRSIPGEIPFGMDDLPPDYRPPGYLTRDDCERFGLPARDGHFWRRLILSHKSEWAWWERPALGVEQ